MEIATTEATMSKAQMMQEAARLEESADNLYLALLAPSMAEQGMRDDAKALRERASA